MGKATLTFACTVLAALWSGLHPVVAGPPAHAEWELTFEDEFNGEGVNWDVWQSQASIRGGTKPEGRWPENNVVKDGILYQVSKRENPARGGKEWSTAHIWTKEFAQTYGYFEARMRYGKYLNNAFWLIRFKTARFAAPPHFEIDINEGHTPREVAMCLHFWHKYEGADHPVMHSRGKRWDAAMDLEKDFHLYGCEWNEKEIIWYLDGQPIRRLQNPGLNTAVDVRLSTVFMERQLKKDGVDISTMDGVSMAVDWVRVWRKQRDLRPAVRSLPLEKCEAPKLVKRDPLVSLSGKTTPLVQEGFESSAADALPTKWEVGDGKPGVVVDEVEGPKKPRSAGNKVLRLAPNDYTFILLDKPITGRLVVELDYWSPAKQDGLLLVTLGRFNKADEKLRKSSYYTGDIGPYIHWRRAVISYYSETEKWQPFTTRSMRGWGRVRFVMDVAQGVFDCYTGDRFCNGGPFRHKQRAACGIGLRHRGTTGVAYVDNVVVNRIDD